MSIIFKFQSNLTIITVLHIQFNILFYHISLNSLIMNTLQTKVVEKMGTHIYIQKVLFKNPFVCEIMWKNILHADSPYVSVRRMRITRWVTMDTNILSKCIILVVSKAKLVARTRFNCTFYIHTLIVKSNFSLHIQFTLQRTQCDSIRKTRRSVYCKK